MEGHTWLIKIIGAIKAFTKEDLQNRYEIDGRSQKLIPLDLPGAGYILRPTDVEIWRLNASMTYDRKMWKFVNADFLKNPLQVFI